MRPPSNPDALTFLLVRPRLIGDVVLTTPIIRALRQRFPSARIVYVVEALAAPVVAANPHVSEVIVIRHRRGWRRWIEDVSLARRLRRERADVAVDLHGGSRSGWLTWATRAPVRVGYDVHGRRWNYTHHISRPRGYQPRHSVRNLWDLLAPVDPFFAKGPDPESDPVEMPVGDDARTRVDKRLRGLGVKPTDRVIIIHGAAGTEFRRWPAPSFAAVAAALAGDRADHKVLILGARPDAGIVETIAQNARAVAGDAGSRIAVALDWPLDEVRAVMERGAIFIGGDSGPMHVASTTDIPIVVLFGPTTAATWAPWRPARASVVCIEPGPLSCRPCDQRVCEPGDFRCLRRLEPAEVIAAARRLLERAA